MSEMTTVPSRLEQLLLCSPWDNRWGTISEADFMTCYVEPCFDRRIEELQREKSNLSVKDDEERIGEIEFEIIRLEKNRKDKKEFEVNIGGFSKNPLYIRGFAGCGKSTYLNALIYHKFPEQYGLNIIPITFDLTTSINPIMLFDLEWKNPKFNFTSCKVISLLFRQIGEHLSLRAGESVDEHKCRMKQIVDAYLRRFHSKGIYFEEQFPVFQLLNEYANSKDMPYHAIDPFDITKGKQTDSLSCRLFSLITSFCSYTKDTPPKDMNATDIAGVVMKLQILLSFCSLDDSTIDGEKYRFLLIFDNIEHYIMDDVVYDEDIVELTASITEFIDAQNSCNSRFARAGISFSDAFKFVLVIRDTTDNILAKKNKHGQDHPDIEPDVSIWFPIDTIFEKKIIYYRSNKLANSEELLQLESLHRIMNDTGISGLRTTLSKMYNYNKRRMVRYLTSVFSARKDVIEHYCALSEFISSSCLDNETVNCLKHGARQIIVRLLLDLVERKTDGGYFSRLSAVGADDNSLGTSLPRKIITYLYRCSPIYEPKSNHGLVSFSALVEAIYPHKGGPRELPIDKAKPVAEILCAMCDSSRQETHWCQLVSIRFARKGFSADSLALELKKQYENVGKAPADEDEVDGAVNKKVYGLKITEAGRTYARMLPDFEYFACRYEMFSPPLFSLSSLDKVRVNSREFIFKCLQTIASISSRTEQCINCIMLDDAGFVTEDGTKDYNRLYSERESQRLFLYVPPKWAIGPLCYGKEQIHPIRIITSHINYLDSFRIFVLTYNNFSEAGNVRILTSDDKLHISTEILKVIEKIYISKLSELLLIHDEETASYYVGGHYRAHNPKQFARFEQFTTSLERAKEAPLDAGIRIKL